ncbi:MAG TPA: NB-ARC domain-containing protein [Acidimicrobiales bacterium]|nr:NB-ARC domain-containing protein [Acidimicrobiales bacterium]
MTAMDMAAPGGSSVDARIHGDVSGQVAVGNNILQNNVSHGGVVYVAAPGQKATVRRRSSPIQLAGRAGPPLLGREFELAEVASGLQVAGVVQVCGSPGAGKTSLLKSVVHGPPPDTAADGVVYHAAQGEPVDDVLQSLFEAFYASDVPFKPTDVEIRHALQPIRALVALDDVTQTGDRMQRVLDAAPNAAFVLASPRPVLTGAGSSLSLQGLGEEAALALLERGLGRALTTRERPAAQAIVGALEGQPLWIVQVAGVVKQLNQSLHRLARQMRPGDGVET